MTKTTLPFNNAQQSGKGKLGSYHYLAIGFIGGLILTTLFFLYVSGSATRNVKKLHVAGSVHNESLKKVMLTQPLLELIKIRVEDFVNQQKEKGEIRDAAVIVVDLNTGQEFIVNQSFVFSPSSLMKVPVMMACLNQIQKGKLTFKDKIVYKHSIDLEVKGNAAKATPTILQEGTEYSIEELLHSMICESDNEATFLLINKIGIQKVKKLEKKVGFVMPVVSHYYDSYATIDKYALFFKALWNKNVIGEEMSDYALDLLAKANWNHGIRKGIPSDIVVHHKYGLNSYPYSPTEERVDQINNFAIVELKGNPFILGIACGGDNETKILDFLENCTKEVYKDILAQIYPSSVAER